MIAIARRASLLSAFAVVAISGHVLDRTTGQPLAHVRVTVGAAHATTDARGTFTLRGVKAGRADVAVESDDVPLQHFAIDVAPHATHLDIHACSTTLDYNCGAPAPDFGTHGG